MAYAEDLKSSGAKAPCGFDPRPRHSQRRVCAVPANLRTAAIGPNCATSARLLATGVLSHCKAFGCRRRIYEFVRKEISWSLTSIASCGSAATAPPFRMAFSGIEAIPRGSSKMSKDAVPTHLQLLSPTLEALKQMGGSGSNQEILDKVVAIINLPEEVQKIPHGSGTELGYRLMWARTYLRLFGALQPRRVERHAKGSGDDRAGCFICPSLGSETVSAEKVGQDGGHRGC